MDAAPLRFLRYACRHDIVTGSNHQLFNLFVLLAESSVLGRVALIPDLTLASWHNGGKSVTAPVSRYVDLSPCAREVSFAQADAAPLFAPTETARVAEAVSTSELVESRSPLLIRHFQHAVFRSPMNSDARVRERFYRLRGLARPSREVCDQADRVSSRLGDFSIVHVRRTDMLALPWWRFPGLDRGTRPQAIRRRIRRWIKDGSTLYVMSDEPQPGFFDPLKNWYRVCTYRDFPDLVRLREEDNYLLYEVEKHMANKARVRVEMFNDYPQYGQFPCSLFDYPRSGTLNRWYRLAGRIVSSFQSRRT